MSSYNRESVLGTCGNYPIKPSGQPVFSDDGKVNGLSGEIFVFDPKKLVTLDATDIATAPYVSIAVALGKEGHMADVLRYIAGEKYNLCDFHFKPRVTKPSCGVPHVIDFYFDELEAGESYAIEVLLDDSWVRSNLGTNEKAKYVFPITMPKGYCDDCDPQVACEIGSCLFVDKINGKVSNDPNKVSRFYRKDPLDQYQPFRAAQLFMETIGGSPLTTRSFCLALNDTDCENCSDLDAITGVRIDGVETLFSFTVNPADTTKTLPGQVDRVVKLLNDALESRGGSAFLKRGLGKCCQYEIEINSCADDIVLIGDGADIEPSSLSNPFASNDVEVVCQTCDNSGTSNTAKCGVRLFASPVEVPCNCEYPDNLPSPNTYIRTLEVQNVGGWDCTGFYKREVCKPEVPEGFGYFYQKLGLRKNSNGGKGRDFRNSNRSVGYPALPDEFSRFTNAARGIKCEETYCVYNLMNTNITKGYHNNARLHANTSVDYILIPQKDINTRTDFETILAALQDRGICSLGDINCDVPVTGVTISQTTASIAVGGTVDLDVVVEPSNALQSGTWTSSDPAVAAVDKKGVVTGVSAGTATITFTASDGVTTVTSTITVA